MRHAGYFIGQEVPLEQGKPIQTGDMVAWYVFQTPPQREESAKAWLERRGVEAWYPSETRWRRIPRGKRQKAPYEARLVPRYIFARFTGYPAWDVVQSCRWLSRVVGMNGEPMPVTDDVMAQMEKVPERLEVIRKREIEKRTLRPGDKAKVASGPFEGWVVEVQQIHAGIASFIVPLFGGETVGKAEEATLRKIAGGA